ncbi:dihydropteroate synthase [Mycolicibacterium sp. (ex Dasyatis americana)]|uniref:dihydropteroate synthase n=1 Tax=Mycobacterium sp. DBP42 TaxID=2545267 RepID=UPI000871EEDA|nr:dihydropteroate synthase [Mycobacterium sp. DBP42]OFB40931.1 dihydropteroate synthase [Mycolicibacterium sp. (ex Dasyatis americana)]TMS52270.1 dihydropteroate synthase [Mycobacterium sp. DBP42]
MNARSCPTQMRVMGVLNATPDSFWVDSRFDVAALAVAAGRRMFDAGAWAVDVGGESSRPGAVPVSVDEELARVLPVVAGLVHLGTVSVDTRNREVAEAAVRAGAGIINDVSGKLYDLAGHLGVGYVSMHSHTVPVLAGVFPQYDDVVSEVTSFVTGVAQTAIAGGAHPVWIDPGIGFGKSADHNLELLRHLPAICSGRFPVLLGVSRKSFIGHVTGRGVEHRLAGSLAAVAPAWAAGVDVIRVHDVVETLDTIAMLQAIWG